MEINGTENRKRETVQTKSQFFENMHKLLARQIKKKKTK